MLSIIMSVGPGTIFDYDHGYFRNPGYVETGIGGGAFAVAKQYTSIPVRAVVIGHWVEGFDEEERPDVLEVIMFDKDGKKENHTTIVSRIDLLNVKFHKLKFGKTKPVKIEQVEIKR